MIFFYFVAWSIPSNIMCFIRILKMYVQCKIIKWYFKNSHYICKVCIHYQYFKKITPFKLSVTKLCIRNQIHQIWFQSHHPLFSYSFTKKFLLQRYESRRKRINNPVFLIQFCKYYSTLSFSKMSIELFWYCDTSKNNLLIVWMA